MFSSIETFFLLINDALSDILDDVTEMAKMFFYTGSVRTQRRVLQ